MSDAVHVAVKCTRNLYVNALGVFEKRLKVIVGWTACKGESAISENSLSRTLRYDAHADVFRDWASFSSVPLNWSPNISLVNSPSAHVIVIIRSAAFNVL